MTHHMINQTGHEFPNMIGVNPGDLDRKVSSFLPSYMAMGETGMGEMGERTAIVKVRDELASYDQNPGGTNIPQVWCPASPAWTSCRGMALLEISPCRESAATSLCFACVRGEAEV